MVSIDVLELETEGQLVEEVESEEEQEEEEEVEESVSETQI